MTLFLRSSCLSLAFFTAVTSAVAEPETVIYEFEDEITPVKRETAPKKEESTKIAKNDPGLQISTRSQEIEALKSAESQQGMDAGSRFIQTLARRPVTSPSMEAPKADKPPSNFPWKKDIVTTTFWIGQGASGYNSTMNKASAWDGKWKYSFGGEDKRNSRDATGLLPATFAAKENPFYIALPFNDVKYPEIAAEWIPWWDPVKAKNHRWKSQCKGRWVKIRSEDGRICYAQWEDVGPFRYDHAEYIWGKERPTTYNKAGLDISPAVEKYLGLTGLDVCDWKFVEAHEVPEGPWLKYGEQAILYKAIERAEKEKKRQARKK